MKTYLDCYSLLLSMIDNDKTELLNLHVLGLLTALFYYAMKLYVTTIDVILYINQYHLQCILFINHAVLYRVIENCIIFPEHQYSAAYRQKESYQYFSWQPQTP